MAISFVGSSTGINSATLPAHQAGDIIIAFAFRDGSATYPTVPAGWTAYRYSTGTTCSASTAIIVATNSSTVSGTWTNATSVIFHVYRGVSFASNTSGTAGTTTTVTFPACSIYNAKSWVVGFVGSRSTNVVIESAPSGMVNRSSVSDATDEAAGHDTNSQVSSFALRTVNIGGTASGWVTSVIELADIRQDATATITGIQLTSALDNKSFINTNWWTFFFGQNLPLDSFVTADWHAFFFERGVYLEASASAVKSITSLSGSTSVGSVSAIGQQNATKAITGLNISTSIGSVLANGAANKAITGLSRSTSIGTVSVTISDTQTISGIVVNSDIGQVYVLSSSNKTVTGQSSQSYYSSIYAAGDSLAVIDGQELNQQNGNVSADGSASAGALVNQMSGSVGSVSVTISDLQAVPGVVSFFDFSVPNVNADSKAALTGSSEPVSVTDPNVSAGGSGAFSGIELFTEYGEVVASANNSQDASVSIIGAQLDAEFSNVYVDVVNPQTWSSGQIKRYPASAFKNSSIKLSGIVAQSSQNDISASGTVQIDATISVNNVVSFSQVANINANGILSISDDEIILLMAA